MHQYVMKQVKTRLLSPFVMPQIKIKAIYMKIKVFFSHTSASYFNDKSLVVTCDITYDY